MVIAVYGDLKSYQAINPDMYFIKCFLESLSFYYPHHRYYLLQPNSIDEHSNELRSFSHVNLKTKPGLLYNYRINRKVTHALNVIKADMLVSIDSLLKSQINQTVLLTRLNRKKRLSSQKLKKEKYIMVLSQEMKNILEGQYEINARKIFIAHGGPSVVYEPIDDEVKSLIKEKYTDGKEFFLYRGRIKEENNIISLLKAFSLFKKRQKSSMKLVLMGKVYWTNSDFKKLMDTYKYRDEIVLITDELLAEEATVVATAYALIQPFATNNLFAFDAMQCAVPVLSVTNSMLKEITSDAAIFFDAADEKDMADRMMLIYKDERLRSQIIEKGKDVIKNYQWKKTVDFIAQGFQ